MFSQHLTTSRPCRHAILGSRRPPTGSRGYTIPAVNSNSWSSCRCMAALPHATVEERRRNHGYVTGVFQIGNMVEAALQGLERAGIVLRIEDEAAPADRRMLYDSHARSRSLEPGARGGTREACADALADDRGACRPPLGAALRPDARVSGRPAELQPWTVLSSGLPFVGLLGVFLLIVTGRATVIEQLMVERTAQLDISKRLEAEAEQRRREAEVLAELARTVNAALEVDSVLQRVTDGAGSCAIAMGPRSPCASPGRGSRHLLLGRSILSRLPGCADRAG